jgi:hypothetical protein
MLWHARGTNSGLGFPWFSARIIPIRANIVEPLWFTTSIVPRQHS